jgi:hypothetical protein
MLVDRCVSELHVNRDDDATWYIITHTHIQTYIHTCMYISIYKYIHTYMYTHIGLRIHSYITYTHTYVHNT